MPFLTAAAIEVGKAVAKAIFKFWMKDSALGEDISSSLIDLVGSQTSDQLAQRKGKRQFEEIGDKISEEILPLLESEGAQLDEGDRRAVALAVAETLNKSRFSKEVLLQQNLQPNQLAQQLLAANSKATRDFSEAATSFYERIIKECCTYIVDISSQLPSFTEHTFAEVLKREDLIIAKVNRVLEELCKMGEQLNSTDEVKRFEKDYRQAVARNLDVLQLIGADVSLPNRRHKLTVAYITLSVVQKQSSPNSMFDSSYEDSKADYVKNTVTVDTALASSSRLLLIRGLAGSGKTTLLQWIAVRAATKSFKDQLASWNGRIPFYIRLRHYAQMRLPKPESFPDFAAPAIVGTMPKEWVHGVLRSGQAIVLVDGVDEVSAAQREEVHTWLRDLVDTYQNSRFIVTSRPHAIEDGWMSNIVFSDAMLQEMALVDIFSFIDHWHEAVKQELHLDEEKDELDSLADHLKGHVKRIRPIRNLATNPLLCAMLCALNRERRRQLPVNRIELYAASCSLLLERREKESRIDLSDYPELNYSQKQRLLEDLAYWMLKENLSVIETEVVDKIFKRKLANMPNIPAETNARAVRKFFVQRSGIIREPAAGQIDFAHRTFQDFFAAQAALDTLDIVQLVSNAHNDQWREVIILAAGLASKILCEQLMRGLIERGDKEIEHRYQLHLLAVACLETTIELEPEIKFEVEKRLSQLVPPKSISDANALSAAGELAVKHLDKKLLEQKGVFPATTYAACIKALALIGGEAAIDLLEGYSNDTRETVINELLAAWDLFDREVFARRILSQTLQNRSSLRLTRLPSLDGIQYFTSLSELDLSYCTQFDDLEPLACLTNLRELDLSGCSQLNDFKPLARLINLRKLNLSGCSQFRDIELLAGLTNLRELDLSGCSEVRDIKPLARLINLIKLSISDCTELSYIEPLARLINLTNLDLKDCSQLHDIEPLAGLTNLRELDLSGCTQLSNIRYIGLTDLTLLNLENCSQLNDVSLTGLVNLTELNLENCLQLSDISLTGLVNLSELDLAGRPLLNHINLTDLTNLSELNVAGCVQLINITFIGLTNIIKLSLSGCIQLRDTKPLAGLINLCELDLVDCNQLCDIRSLASLINLRELDLTSCTQLRDIKPLEGLTNLTRLNLANCSQLRDIKPLEGLINLTSLDLTNCSHLSNVKPLASLTNLRWLDLTNCTQLEDIKPLTSLINLRIIK